MNTKMTKASLFSTLSEVSGTPKKDIVKLFDIFTDLAYTVVNKTGEFPVPGLGKLVKVNRAARDGRNPQTGEAIKIAAKTVVKFRLAKACKESCLK